MTTFKVTSDQEIVAHSTMIDRLIADALPRSATIADLMPRLAGAGPTEVIQALNRALAEPALRSLAASVLDMRPMQQNVTISAHDRCLPLPHPLDSEWRFTDSSVSAIIDHLLDVTSAGDTLLLVGTPSVAIGLACSNADRRFSFVGPGDAVTDAVQDRFADDTRLVPFSPLAAKAALFDPPWYIEAFRAMAKTAVRGVMTGGHVFAAMPREATRPRMAESVSEMMAAAAAVGLRPDGSRSLEVAYDTPLFELSALEQLGLPNALGSWRRGDLVHLRKFSEVSIDGKRPMPRPAHVELTLEGCRVRLALGTGIRGVGFGAVEDHEISRSISARSPTRKRANLWTSTNRAFSVDESDCIVALLGLAREEDLLLPKRFTHRRIESLHHNAVEQNVNLIHRLRELFVREIADAQRLLGEGSWLRSAKGIRC